MNSFDDLIGLPLAKLVCIADEVRREHMSDRLELCSILNAKSGRCAENCKFCAQSARHATAAPVYPLKSKEEMLEAARTAKAIGAERFDIVTSGNRLTREEIDLIARTIVEIRQTVGIPMCASLGELSVEDLVLLKKAGLGRYHHNIETSRNFFPRIVTTHSFDDRIATIRAAKCAGLQVCSGGILGMGESWQDRIDMALELKTLEVDSVPLNVLVPVRGTAMENTSSISCADVIRTIAIFRIILKDKIIKVAAGRESMLSDFQAMAFMAGANGMLIGGYLTIKGRQVEQDRRLAEEIKKIWKP